MSARLSSAPAPPPAAGSPDLPAQASALPRHARGLLLRQWPTAVMVALDVLGINLAFVVAYLARYQLEIGGEVLPVNFVPLSSYRRSEALWTLILLLLLVSAGLYRRRRSTNWLDRAIAIIKAASIGYVVLNAFNYLLRAPQESRLMDIYVWGGTIVLLTAVRIGEDAWRALARARGRGVDRLLVVGGGDTAKMLMQRVADQPGLGYELVGFLDDVAASQGADFGRFQVLGGLGQLPQVIREHRISEAIICLPGVGHQAVWNVVTGCERAGVGYMVVPDLFEMSVSRVDVNSIAGIPLLAFKEVSIHGWNRVLKRALDVAVAIAVLAISAPIWLLVALAVKLDSPGPVLFRQARVGRGGRHFTLYKFRSMCDGAERQWAALLEQSEVDGPILKIKKDPRLTRVGRFIRRWSLDEIPQFLNVLRGEMSVVGPRPPLPAEVEKYEDWHLRRLEVDGGITGLWQVSGRSHLAFDEMVMLDIYYIENWSLSLDFKIMLRTVPAVLFARGSY